MSSRNILNLPLEVLNLVYKSIPDMRDKLNLAMANDYLGKAFAFHAGDIFKKIEIKDRPITDWSDILFLCGSSVTTILTNEKDNSLTVIELASKYCPNLKEFHFPVRRNSWNQIKPLLLALKNLSWIGIMKDYYGEAYVVDTLLKMPKLKCLKLSGFIDKDLQGFGKLVNLTQLTIINSELYTLFDTFTIFSPMKSINKLELTFAVFKMPKNYAGEQLWPKIESLRIYNGKFYTPLPYLPTLKYLTIEGTSSVDLTEVFGQSVDNYGKTLESLRFYPVNLMINRPRYINVDELGIIMELKALKVLQCRVRSDGFIHYISLLENLEQLNLQQSGITNSGVMMVIYRCKKLRHLYIFGCRMVKKDIFLEAVPF
ncbi:uncharacterized protein LOC110178923 [Drosophila serrata]|uniref:uncharacterized protein LOC110178923 n=1 Tax=Drosophila serrata TaxID=7274 RepID=UPI000A1D216B|nr:uncharacterized protein LOC110178923 [Drosophila serrata]